MIKDNIKNVELSELELGWKKIKFNYSYNERLFLLNIRTYIKDKETKEFVPTKKGIVIDLEFFNDLYDSIKKM